MKVAIIGIGRVGLVVAACLSEMGHDVTGVDLPPVVESLNRGRTRFFEPGLDEMVAKNVRAGHLRATTHLADVADSQVIWIAIGTEQTSEGAMSITCIEHVVAELGRLCTSKTVIALKSTMPIGACRRMAEGLPVGGPLLTNNPEFLRQGSAIHDFFNPGKTVVGTGPRGGTELLARIYEPLPGPKIFTNWDTAEAIKLTQNTFNALRISFMNELSLATEGMNISLEQVSNALREDEAALRRYLNPGFSYGGSCLPNNVAYLSYLARCRGYAAPLLEAIKAVNDLRISHLAEKIVRELGGLEGRRVALWGLTYKADTDDLRNSPSVGFANTLLKRGARVLVSDPFLQAVQVEQFNYTYCQTAEGSLASADALVALTRCPEFASVPLGAITSTLDTRCIFDMVGALPQLQEEKLYRAYSLQAVQASSDRT